MKLHSDTLTPEDLESARFDAQEITGGWLFLEVIRCGSRSRTFGFEVKLTGDGSQSSRRVNPGSGNGSRDEYAAGYAAYGWFLAALYDTDLDMVVGGSEANAIYKDSTHFHERTAVTSDNLCATYSPFDTDLSVESQKLIHAAFGRRGGQPSRYVSPKVCDAIVKACQDAT